MTVVRSEEVHQLMLRFLAEMKTDPQPRQWYAPDRDVYGTCLYEFHYWLKQQPESTALLNADEHG